MKVNKLSSLLGVKIESKHKHDAQELSHYLLMNIINFFKSISFGVITLKKFDNSNKKHNKFIYESFEQKLSKEKLNYIKFSANWLIKLKEIINIKEIGYFILDATFEDMIRLSSEFDQEVFVYSENSNAKLFYSNGSEINLEPDKANFGSIAQKAILLNFVDFKLFIDQVIDFYFRFENSKDIKISDTIFIISKPRDTKKTSFDVIEVHDIRQNGFISFKRGLNSPEIKPVVYHHDEIVWAAKMNEKFKRINSVAYQKAI